jgi:DNA/RNA endonuclease G (NUC1)
VDDVFFQSTHLKLGNPTFARPLEDTHRENYLIEKPQYSLSYNDAIKGPNWVIWQLNRSWLGDVKRGDIVPPKISQYPPANFPPESVYSADSFDYPWLSDNTLPPDWVKTASPDYRASFGLDKGHMTASADRNRTKKDIYSTYFTTNVLPQDNEANQFGAWRQFEIYSNETLVQNDNKELYIIAGGVGYGEERQTGFPPRTVQNNILLKDGFVQTDNNGKPKLASSLPKDKDKKPIPGFSLQSIENAKLIRVPEYIWKIAVVMEPGQEIADITDQTEVYALITPNRSQLKKPVSFPLPNGASKNITDWNDWTQWEVSVDYLEEITGYDFLSNVPEEIQRVIES